MHNCARATKSNKKKNQRAKSSKVGEQSSTYCAVVDLVDVDDTSTYFSHAFVHESFEHLQHAATSLQVQYSLFEQNKLLLIDTGTTFNMLPTFDGHDMIDIEDGDWPVKVGNKKVMCWTKKGVALLAVHNQITDLLHVIAMQCLLAPEMPITLFPTASRIDMKGSIVFQNEGSVMEMKKETG